MRRDLWQQLRRLPDDRFAKRSRAARWALLKNPEDLTATQAAQLAASAATAVGSGGLYEMKEQFRAIFAADLEPADAIEALDRWCTRAVRSRLAPFVKAARTMRDRRGIIVNALTHGITNAPVEGLNTKVRLIIRRGYGFHSAKPPSPSSCSPADQSTSSSPTNTNPIRPPRDPHDRQESRLSGLVVVGAGATTRSGPVPKWISSHTSAYTDAT